MKISELQSQRNVQSISSLDRKQKFEQTRIGTHSKVEDFSEILGKKLQAGKSIKFSAHAKKRISSRQIDVDLQRLETGLERVKNKGGDNSLVMIDKNAFIVNVKNQTVITAVDQASLKNNVFTNIDSVAIV